MKPTPTQLEAIACSSEAYQILACAGSGKTEVLARRVVRFLRQGVDAESIVAFTFTEKAAKELRDRIESRAVEADPCFRSMPPCSAGLYVGTIHSYCLRLLQQFGGLYEVFDPLAEEQEWALLHRFARRLGLVQLFSEAWPGQPVSVRRAVEVFRDSLAVVYNERIPRAVLGQRAPAFAAIVERYEDLLYKMRLLSFDQMVERACAELSPGTRIWNSLKGQIRCVLVDEYQDLNRAQAELVQKLVALGAGVTVVGDDDQAIYQWRGGDVSLFLDFPKQYTAVHRHDLAENHRSVEPIVNLSNSFTQTIRQRVSKSMIPQRRSQASAIELLNAGTAEQEAEVIVQRIRAILQNGHKPSDIAVLYRSVRTSSGSVVKALRKAGIPLALVGKLSLLDKPEMALLARVFVWWAGGCWRPDEVQEVVTDETLAHDISDLTGAAEGKAKQTVGQLRKIGTHLTEEGISDLIEVYMEMLRVIGLPVAGPECKRQEQGLGQFSRLLGEFAHGQRRAAPVDFFQHLEPASVDEKEEDEALVSAESETADASRTRLGKSPGEIFLTRLRVFLETYASHAAEESPERPILDRDAVNIMTIHQAKGLEFPVVFMPSLVQRRFPSTRTGMEKPWYLPEELFQKDRYQGSLEDERRLFYVGMTRARDLLVLSFFTQYSNSPAQYSQFIKDLIQGEYKHLLKPILTCRPTIWSKLNQNDETLETDFGQLLTFSECSYKYYYRYICGFVSPINPALGYGKMLHHVIAELARRCKDGRPPSSDELDEILRRDFYLPFAGPIPFKSLYDAAHRRLQKFVQEHGSVLARTIEPEFRFEMSFANARVRGRIDLLVQADDGSARDVEILDFKTAEKRPPTEQHQNQLRLYAEAVRFLGMNPVKLIIHDLDSEKGEHFLVEENESERDVFREKMHCWLRDIREGNFDRKREDGFCENCDFMGLCRLYPLSR
ncbi:ATP-dependent helicase [candidate division KSB1 bacterium]|nr:ATP-dependent helicase [candidate division KSB1 bacterium]NIV69018.1 UvrD-helicase domain-containing protein [Phycisphaerae bacterium]NIR69017.1 ATP-dependent helicase [candidate division KSB1 bacterium]NIS24089.1 ATP-dependent helicase [candidate division KSB1 bacterium]NIT71008.1 ATP-dependent helicase [candidate division KSB1 bacterium]